MISALKEAKGLLLYGPAGTGKADMARALAEQLSAVFINRMASELDAARGFEAVREEAAARPAVLFVEGLDVACDGGGLRRSVDALILEMDSLARQRVLVVASVSRPDRLDPALLRGGRFSVRVPVGLPDLAERLAVLESAARGLALAPDADLRLLARETGGLSSEQLVEINRAAALIAAGRGAFVGLADFREAIDRWARAQQRKPIMDGVERFVTAYHEAGHALASHLLPYADPVRKITIVPHGLNWLGVAKMSIAEGHDIVSRACLLDKMAVALAGRAAEEIAVGHARCETEDDVDAARRVASGVVSRMLVDHGEAPDDRQKRLIEDETSRLVAEAGFLARRTLTKHSPSLDALAAALLDKETLRSEDISRLLPVCARS